MNRNKWMKGEKREQIDYPYLGDIWRKPDGKFFYVLAVRGTEVFVASHTARKSEELKTTITRINRKMKEHLSGNYPINITEFRSLKRVYQKDPSPAEPS